MTDTSRPTASRLPQVQAQYEAYPYPPRDPAGERRRLRTTWLGWLPQINHYCFRGRQSFEGARVLVAGAGTGDATIFLAEQLRDRDAEVVSLDFSHASTAIARERARVRELTNIRWVEASLLDLPRMGLGPFDYINCTGVLHHLEDPDAGLRALRAALKPDGAMGLMLYATCGRTGVYQMQELMRRINRGEGDMERQLANTRKVLQSLPPTNWFKRGEALIADHRGSGDAGLFDLFLHTRDRSYTVPELYDFLTRAGLRLVEFAMPHDRFRLDPDFHTADPRLRARFAALDPVQRQAAAELIAGDVIAHRCYVAPAEATVADPTDPGNVPFVFGLGTADGHLRLADSLRGAPDGRARIDLGGVAFSLEPGRYTDPVLREMDGRRTTPEVFAAVRARLGDQAPTDAALAEDFGPVYRQLNRADLILLRHRSVPPFTMDTHAGPAPPAA